MASMTLDPATTVEPSGHINVSLAGLDPKVKFALTTTDAAGTEVGITSNTNRPRRNGTAAVGIYAPPREGLARVTAYQRGVKVAEQSITVKKPPIVVEPVPPTDVPFLERPASGAISRSGGSAVVIENVTIRGSAPNQLGGVAITVRGVRGDVVIRDVDLADVIGGIYIYDCIGTLTIENVRSRNIGDGTIGAGHSNHIQLAESSLTGAIRKSRFLGGRTEDMLSTWHSGGRGQGQELILEDNQLQGLVSDTATTRAWISSSGTGIIISDGAGSPKNGWIIVRRNTLLTPGQVGLQHIDGSGIQTLDNVVYGEKRAGNNNPITSWEGDPKGVIRGNRYYWTNADGSHPDPWMHRSPSGMVLTDNVEDPTIDPNALRIVL